MRAVVEAVWGLLVEDGSLAVGIVVTLAITWATAVVVRDDWRPSVGWLLLGMITALVVVNLALAGRRGRRTAA